MRAGGFTALVVCWRCKAEVEITAPDESTFRTYFWELGFVKGDGLIWCQACWNARKPSEGYSGKQRSDAVER